MDERIKRVLSIFLENNNKAIILGAWGCGVFRLKPSMISKIFYKYLKNKNSIFYNKFNNVTFSILGGPEKNRIEFEKYFLNLN